MPPLVHLYDELKVRIDSVGGAAYRVYASTDSANVAGSFELPFEELELENFILKVSRSRGRRRVDASALGDAKRFGGPLFKALFREQVNGLYHDALTIARDSGHGLRITLCLNGAPELMDVPWEYLFDEPDFLAASAFTPVVRYLDLARGHRPLRVQPPLRILGVVSSPSDYETLDVDRERANLERALAALTHDGAVELHWLEQPSLSGLLRKLQDDTYHALHFIGHGSFDERAEEGVLLFEGEDGRGRPVSGDKLGMILHDFTSLRLAVLNACEGARTARSDPFAGVAGSIVRRDIPAVVAMQFEISDEAAIAFAGGFYEGLARGWPADTSVAAARLAMLAERSDDIEWGTPVLFMRVPDGQLFELDETLVKRPPPVEVPPEAVVEVPAEAGIEVPTEAGVEAPAEAGVEVPTETVTGDSATTAPGDGGRGGAGDGRRKWVRWLWPIPLVVALIVILVVALGGKSSPSNVTIARNWLQTIDAGNYVKAASFWRPDAFWTGLKGGTTPLASSAAILSHIKSNSKCHRVIENVRVDAANDTVRLRVFVDGPLPGRTCRGTDSVWFEDYLIQRGYIRALIFRPAPGSRPGVKSSSTQSGSATGSATTQSSGAAASSGSGSATSSAAPAGTGTQSVGASSTPSPSGPVPTTSGTVPAPPTTTGP